MELSWNVETIKFKTNCFKLQRHFEEVCVVKKKKIKPSKQLIKITIGEDGLKPGSYVKSTFSTVEFWDLSYSDRHKLQHMVVGGRGIVRGKRTLNSISVVQKCI